LADTEITETGCVWEQNAEDFIWTIKRGNIIRTANWYISVVRRHIPLGNNCPNH